MTISEKPSSPGRTIRGGATRDGILENAAALFALKGFEGTAFKDIADEMGITRPALYHYFASKYEVLEVLIAETSESTAEEMRAVRRRDDLSPSEKLHSVTANLVRERMAAPQRFRMLDRTESALPTEIANKHLAARRAVLSELTAIIVDGIRTGQFRETDERLAALSVIGMCNWVAWWYVPGRDKSDNIPATLADSAVAMLARPKHRLPTALGPAGAIAQIRDDLDYLDRLISE